MLFQIRRAYRNLLTKTHPDKGGDSDQFDRIKAAYEVLADSEKVNLVQGVLSSIPHQTMLKQQFHSAEGYLRQDRKSSFVSRGAA